MNIVDHRKKLMLIKTLYFNHHLFVVSFSIGDEQIHTVNNVVDVAGS